MLQDGQESFHVLSFSKGPEASGRVQHYKSRKPHRKSQNGCLICKRRRIKCDERVPACQNCVKHGARCSYSAATATGTDQDLETSIPITVPSGATSRLFEYFIKAVVQTVMPLSRWALVAPNVIRSAMDEEYSMHSILAVSACHYRYHLKSYRQQCVGENFHSMQACSGLRHCLDMPKIDNIDAAITTSIFMGSVSFADTPVDFRTPLSKRSMPFTWLNNQLSLGSFLNFFQSRTGSRSRWLTIFEGVTEAILQLYDDRPGADGIPAELVTIFDIRGTSVCDTHPYLRVLRRLCCLISVDPENELAVLQYMQFVEGVSSEFVRLLHALDTRALMLLSYWLGLLCAKDCWWSRQRARNECWAICEHIEMTGDELLWRYMDFPAAACGYPYSGEIGVGEHLVHMLRQHSA